VAGNCFSSAGDAYLPGLALLLILLQLELQFSDLSLFGFSLSLFPV
jgi:hypothetical protein